MSDDKTKQQPRDLRGTDWEQRLSELCGALSSLRSSDADFCTFFSAYRDACHRVAYRLLKDWKWAGDIPSDAQEIASESTAILIGQLNRERGIFGARLNSLQKRGYLSRTIWRSCAQIAMRMKDRSVTMSLQVLLEEGKDFPQVSSDWQHEGRDELDGALAYLEAVRGRFRKIPRHISMTDFLLFADSNDERFSEIKKRTRQRYLKQIRELHKKHRGDRNQPQTDALTTGGAFATPQLLQEKLSS